MEVILNLMPWIWGCLFVATIVIELKTADLVAIWFSIGSLLTLIISLIFPHLGLIYQLSIFIFSTILFIMTLGKWAKKKYRIKNISNNADLIVGKEITILEDCNEFDKGSGMIDDVVWITLCQSGNVLKKGEIGIVVAIDANKLIVKQK